MSKPTFIVLLGLLFSVAIIHSARLPYEITNELGFENQKLFKKSLIPRNQFKTYDLLRNNRLTERLTNSMRRQDFLNFCELLKQELRNTNDAEKKFQVEMLNAHNTYRACHNVPALELDDELNKSAQKYANEMAKNDMFEHSSTPDVGENLWMMQSSESLEDINGAVPTAEWYNEIKDYNFETHEFSSRTGHFTQLVWKTSRKMGAGIAYSSDRSKAYAVAQYTPQGNVYGAFAENVPRPQC